MAWLNSDDLYLPWTLRTVAEIFATHPDVQWITGVNAWWDDAGRLTHAQKSYKNVYDYLLGRYAWIQQESTFWRRSLWEEAGGRLDESYRLMVDGELWTRFFARAPLHHVGCVLGGFRAWGGNRSADQMDACHLEMRRCIDGMRKSSAPDRLAIAKRLQAARSVLAVRGISRLKPIAARALQADLARASYELLAWDGARWVSKRKPYEL
jgi:hypothetical protein